MGISAFSQASQPLHEPPPPVSAAESTPVTIESFPVEAPLLAPEKGAVAQLINKHINNWIGGGTSQYLKTDIGQNAQGSVKGARIEFHPTEGKAGEADLYIHVKGKELGRGSKGVVTQTVHLKVQTSSIDLSGNAKQVQVVASHLLAQKVVLKTEMDDQGMDVKLEKKVYQGEKRELEKEGKLLKKFDGCPNVLQAHHIGLEGKHGILMEQMNCGDLHDLVLAKLPQLAELTGKTEKELLHDIVQQTVEAVCQIHERGCIHYDIKPENFLVNFDPVSNKITIKIADLGMTKEQEEKHTLTGSRPYLSPERFEAQVEVLFSHSGADLKEKPKADLFALGFTIYELVNNERPPFWSETESNDAEKIKNKLDEAASLKAKDPVEFKRTKDTLEDELREAIGTYRNHIVESYFEAPPNLTTYIWKLMGGIPVEGIEEEGFNTAAEALEQFKQIQP